MHGMTMFAVGVASFLGTCVGVYILAMHRYDPAERSAGVPPKE